MRQTSAEAAYAATSWCIANSSHITRSGNLVLALGGTTGEGKTLDCVSNRLDLDPGDCAQVSLPRASAEPEGLRVCFNEGMYQRVIVLFNKRLQMLVFMTRLFSHCSIMEGLMDK